MSIMNLNKIAETEAQPVFRLQGIPYYPHHSDKHRWVGPGPMALRKVYTTAELLDANAELVTRQLWKRSWTDEVQGWKRI